MMDAGVSPDLQANQADRFADGRLCGCNHGHRYYYSCRAQAAQAKPEFAAQTGLPCGQCHVNPAGGGKLKAFGEKFKANGFKLKK